MSDDNKPVLKVGVAGLGTVGGGVIKLLRDNAALLTQRSGRAMAVTAVSARNRRVDRGFSFDGLTWHDDPVDLAADPNVDVVVELIGGSDGPALLLAQAALKEGKPFVTANKALIARHGEALSALAVEQDAPLRFEAAVAGGIPIIKALSEGLSANTIDRVYAILNGTCNYILSVMEETGAPFEDILADAQKLGYAEADPTFDVDGIDAAHKLAILSSVAFGASLNMDAMFTEGIRHITPHDITFAGELGYKIKLMGVSTLIDDGVMQRVHPCLVSLETAIAHVNGVNNVVVAEGDPIGQTVYQGPGAGEGPTASAVVADLCDVARGATSPILPPPADVPSTYLGMDGHEARYYVRLTVADEPGVMAAITAALRDEDLSIESLIQRSHAAGEPASVLLVTHETNEMKIRRSMERIGGLDVMAAAPVFIRIENL